MTDLIAAVFLGLAGAWLALLVVLWLLRPRDISARELLGVIPDILRLIRDLAADHETPTRVRASLVILLAWLVSPIDLVPEFIPVLGPIDDVIVTVVVLRYVRRRLGEETLRRRWSGSADGFRLLSSLAGRG